MSVDGGPKLVGLCHLKSPEYVGGGRALRTGFYEPGKPRTDYTFNLA